MGKSAQIPLYVWLPDAMEGPTPVSALIHAATMVTAVFTCRAHERRLPAAPLAMDVVAVIGAITAIFAASMALVQNDIKKVLAYSTISQLGYMSSLSRRRFCRGIFHLMIMLSSKPFVPRRAAYPRHGGEQTYARWRLNKKIKYTYITMLTATMAIAEFSLRRIFSKDEFSVSLRPFLLVVDYRLPHAGQRRFICFACSSLLLRLLPR